MATEMSPGPNCYITLPGLYPLSRGQGFSLGTLATATTLHSLLLKAVPDSSNGDPTSKGRRGTLLPENRKNVIPFILTIVQKRMVGKKKKKERKNLGVDKILAISIKC